MKGKKYLEERALRLCKCAYLTTEGDLFDGECLWGGREGSRLILQETL